MFKKLVNNIYRQIKSLWSALQKEWRRLRRGRRGNRSAMTNEQQPREPVPGNDNYSSSQGGQEQIHSYFVGNTNCLYNAHSPYIRCAVNPCGPCEDCPHYEPKE